MYSRDDIKNAIINGKLKIHPFNEKSLTGIGYNISTTHFALSIKSGVLLNVSKKTEAEGFTYYVNIPANDTVLFFSREYIETDDTIAGTFHSKVSRVCQGLSHISTTLDPTWKGQLLISVNNPMSQSVRMELSPNGNILTMIIQELETKVTGENIHNNNKGRCDLLRSHFMRAKRSIFHRKKQLELEEFIVNEFADSLNGYDDFISEEKTDKYTKVIRDLQILKTRLENHRTLIGEHRYSIGSEGKYRILRDADERELISNCVIARLKQITMEDLNQEYTKMEIEQKSDSIIKEIDEYLFIIKYELEEINHSRRIGWQDWVIEERKYISYRSVLSKYLTGRRVEKYIIVSIITAITMWACIYIVLKICGTTEIKPIKILQDNISALTILIVSLIFNGIVEIVRRIVRRFFS